MFDLKNVTFSYDSANIILDDVSMKIEKGVAAAITGNNGCGKTTLLRLLNGLSFPNKGKYFFDGTEITRKKLSDICLIQSGGTPSRSKQEYWNNGNIPWVKISDF